MRSSGFSKMQDSGLTTAFLAFLSIFTILSRAVFQVRGVESFDAINYMLAISHYDIHLHQPQPPGYILYIMVARAFTLIWQDPHQALQWVSAVSSGLAVIAVFLITRELFNRTAGLLAAGALITSTFFWYAGELAAPYTMDVFFSALVAWLCIRYINTGRDGYSWAGAVALGLAGAFRLQTMVFLFPLFFYSLVKRSWLAGFTRPLLAGVVFAAFFIPFNMPDGNIGAFWGEMAGVVPIVSSTNTFSKSVAIYRYLINLVVILRYTFGTLGEPALAFVLLGVVAVLRQTADLRKKISWFLIIWLAPTWIIYLLIWAGNKGTVLITLPPFMVLVGAGADWLIRRPRWKVPGSFFYGLMIAFQVCAFLFFPKEPFGEKYREFETLKVLQDKVSDYQQKIAMIRAYPAGETVIVAREVRFPQYYLPEYTAYSLPEWDPENPGVIQNVNQTRNGSLVYLHDLPTADLLPSGTTNLIFFDLKLMKIPYSPESMQKIQSGKSEIMVMHLASTQCLQWTPEALANTCPAR